MQIAESYFQELIHSRDAIEAVAFLSQFWSTHLDPDKENFGLSEPEYLVQLCLIYSGEVGNGGHVQFFLNRGHDITQRVLHALSALGLVALEQCLREALVVFPDAALPVTCEALEQTVGGFTDAQYERLGELDRMLSREDAGLDDFLLAYLREHQDAVLIEERTD